jgi:hypothetical protein
MAPVAKADNDISSLVLSALNQENIKEECKGLYLDYVEFTRKAIDKKEKLLKKRWINLSNKYKKEFDECQKSKTYKIKSFLRPNPLDKASK